MAPPRTSGYKNPRKTPQDAQTAGTDHPKPVRKILDMTQNVADGRVQKTKMSARNMKAFRPTNGTELSLSIRIMAQWAAFPSTTNPEATAAGRRPCLFDEAQKADAQ